MSNASRKKQSGHSGKFNAFIIPMIVILGILPLIIHLKIYDTNLEDQAYFLEETYPDIFLYYKSLILYLYLLQHMRFFHSFLLYALSTVHSHTPVFTSSLNRYGYYSDTP